MKKKPSFSEAVLARIEARRRARKMLTWRIVQSVMLLAALAGTLYNGYNLRHFVPGATISAVVPQAHDNAFTEDGFPSFLNINGERWAVIRVKSFDDQSQGAGTSCEYRVMGYLPTQPNSMLRAKLLHEIFHAGACLHGGDSWWNSEHPNKIEHNGIYHLAEFWSEFARTNPEFMEWLAR